MVFWKEFDLLPSFDINQRQDSHRLPELFKMSVSRTALFLRIVEPHSAVFMASELTTPQRQDTHHLAEL